MLGEPLLHERSGRLDRQIALLQELLSEIEYLRIGDRSLEVAERLFYRERRIPSCSQRLAYLLLAVACLQLGVDVLDELWVCHCVRQYPGASPF